MFYVSIILCGALIQGKWSIKMSGIPRRVEYQGEWNTKASGILRRVEYQGAG